MKRPLKQRIFLWNVITTTFIMFVVVAVSYLWFQYSLKIEAMGTVHSRIKTIESLILWEKDLPALEKLITETWVDGSEIQWFVTICKKGEVFVQTTHLDPAISSLFKDSCQKELNPTGNPIHSKVGDREIYGDIREIDKYRIVVAMTSSYWPFLQRELFTILVMVFLTGLLILFVMSYLVSKFLTQDVQNLLMEIIHVDFGGKVHQIDVNTHTQEIGEITSSFNALIARLSENYKRIDSFSGNLAHEMLTPLQRMRSSVDYVLTQEPDVDRYEKTLVDILSEINRISKIVNSLLFLAKPEERIQKIRKSEVNGQQLIQEVVELFSQKLQENNIQLKVSVGENVIIKGYGELIYQMIGNVVSNAIRFTPAEGTIAIKILSDRHRQLIVVEDSGPGMSDEFMGLATQRFQQESTQKSETNSGLGLSIVEKIVQLHGGQMVIGRSHRWGGLRIHIFLPKEIQTIKGHVAAAKNQK